MEEGTVIALRRRYSAEVWKERIVSCRTSGQNVAEWCEANEINIKSYYRWERKLLSEGEQQQRVTLCTQNRFAEITPINEKSNAAAVTLNGAGITCEIHNEISPELLRIILAAMAGNA